MCFRACADALNARALRLCCALNRLVMARGGEAELERALYSVDEDVICGMSVKYGGADLHAGYPHVFETERGG